MAHRSFTFSAVLCLVLSASAVRAASLEAQIPSLFGGRFITSINVGDTQDAQKPLVADRFRSLSAALTVARSQAPIPSASGAFRFAWDPDVDTFVRFDQSLGTG